MRTKLIYFIDYMLNKMPIVLVSILSLITCFITAALLLTLLNIFSSGHFFDEFDLIICVTGSILFSSNVTLAVYQGRKSNIFWNAVHDFQGALNEAKTKKDIISLESKYEQLKKLSTTSEREISKLNEFKAVMQTKLELLPD